MYKILSTFVYESFKNTMKIETKCTIGISKISHTNNYNYINKYLNI